MLIQQNILFTSGKFILWDLIGNALFFPVWWYSIGLKKFIQKRWNSFVRKEQEIGFILWASSLFKPMYGQKDFQGKLISFVFRVLVLCWRGVFFFLMIGIQVLFIALWLFLPAISALQLLKYLI